MKTFKKKKEQKTRKFKQKVNKKGQKYNGARSNKLFKLKLKIHSCFLIFMVGGHLVILTIQGHLRNFYFLIALMLKYFPNIQREI